MEGCGCFVESTFDGDKAGCLQFASLNLSGPLKSELASVRVGKTQGCKVRKNTQIWIIRDDLMNLKTHLKNRIQLFGQNWAPLPLDAFVWGILSCGVQESGWQRSSLAGGQLMLRSDGDVRREPILGTLLSVVKRFPPGFVCCSSTDEW